MAFYNKIGSILRQNVSANNPLGAQISGSMFNAIRGVSSKLFVGGLSWGTDDNSLRDAFSGFGEVTEARVITDRETGRSRGFGFVNFDNDESASSAVQAMDGQELNGRNIRVSFAQERAPRSFGNSGGYQGGGGYGGGGYQGGFGGAGANDGGF